MNPGTVFSDVGNFQKVGIETGFGKNIPKRPLVHRWRAGCHDDPVEVFRLDISHNEVLARIRTHVGVVSGKGHLGVTLGKVPDRLHIHMVSNVDPTMANVDTDSHLEYSALSSPSLKGFTSFPF